MGRRKARKKRKQRKHKKKVKPRAPWCRPAGQGSHGDRRKEEDKKRCRGKASNDEEQ